MKLYICSFIRFQPHNSKNWSAPALNPNPVFPQCHRPSVTSTISNNTT